ncbi:hypothetical protein GA0115259_1007520 [Streptomyces sp. MnatMP-M17]|uniref:hypothetical protein n=1 Tax=Streptomyces sp. MnatMP-M17 TaxID=1839780 RepID=UPI00081E77DD|nr:hypothetical protein GA0115259_1007520 [Streptomyces sp. MnatMP-M17]
MGHDESDQVLSCPLPGATALEPPAEWADLRGRCPVARVKLPSGDEASLLTRYDDVKRVLSDPRFSRQLDAPDAAHVSANESGGVFNSSLAGSIPQTGEGHQRWRRMPTLHLAVPARDLRPVEGLAVGGPRELPVRW